jgi:hypothetical protein
MNVPRTDRVPPSVNVLASQVGRGESSIGVQR